MGEESRCVHAQTTAAFPSSSSSAPTPSDPTTTVVHRPACLKVSCDEIQRSVVVHIGTTAIPCEADGQQIPFPSSSTEGQQQTFECPRLAAICPHLVTCPANCAGRGTCRLGNSELAPLCKCSNQDDISSSTSCQVDFGTPSVPRSGSGMSFSLASRWSMLFFSGTTSFAIMLGL